MNTPAHIIAIAAALTACTAAASCSDLECTAGQRKCDGNTFYSCYKNEWRPIECKDNAPICTEDRGCTKSQNTDLPPSSASCSDDEQMCIQNNFYKCYNKQWRIIQCPPELPVCDPAAGCIESPDP